MLSLLRAAQHFPLLMGGVKVDHFWQPGTAKALLFRVGLGSPVPTMDHLRSTIGASK